MENLKRRFSDKVFDAIPGYLTVQDRDLRIVDANQAFRDDFGDFKGRYCYQVYKHRPEKCEGCPVERTFHDGHPHTSEEIVTTLDGREVAVLVNTTPVRNDNGEVKEVVEMSTDITQLKGLHQQILESRERYQQLFEEVPCFVSIQDRDLRIVDANRMFREAFGSNFGNKCYKVYKHRSEECYPCVVRQTFSDGQAHVHEEVVTDKNDKRINVLVHTMPLRNVDGSIDNVIEMSADITQIRQLQSKLASIGLLISSISHGLKGLLNSLDGAVYLMNTGLKNDDRERIDQGWGMAQRNIGRIRNMVLDILYYAKDREPDWETLAVADVFEEVCTIITPKADKLGIELKCSIEDRAGSLEADHQAIRAMFVNLLENSLDACRVAEGDDKYRVEIDLQKDGDYLVFTIEDNGIGMDQETKEKAFSMFFSSKGTEGTGLGLFIANKIAIEHGGTIKLESELRKGTRFTVRLPTVRPKKTETEDAGTPPEAKGC